MKHSKPKLLGVVLCGGRSVRMGRDKAALTVPSGDTFLQIACRRLESLCEAVCVSSSADRLSDHVMIPDSTDSFGPISGIDASLEYAANHGFDGCVFNPVDTPLLTADEVSKLIDVFAKNSDHVVCAVASESAEYLEPLISVYPVAARSVIVDSIKEGRYSLQRTLNSLSVISVPLSAVACQNFNTPSDLNHLAIDL